MYTGGICHSLALGDAFYQVALTFQFSVFLLVCLMPLCFCCERLQLVPLSHWEGEYIGLFLLYPFSSVLFCPSLPPGNSDNCSKSRRRKQLLTHLGWFLKFLCVYMMHLANKVILILIVSNLIQPINVRQELWFRFVNDLTNNSSSSTS